MTPILLSPILAGVAAQGIKFLVKTNQQNFSLKNLISYSGMPSGHSALVVSLAVTVGLNEGWNSSFFAISFILAIIVIRDALGIRRYLGRHGRTLNALIKDLGEDKFLDDEYPHLLEHVGHTPAQVVVGSIIGLAVSLAVFFLL